MVRKVGEINLFFTTFVNKTTMDSFALFHQLFDSFFMVICVSSACLNNGAPVEGATITCAICII